MGSANFEDTEGLGDIFLQDTAPTPGPQQSSNVERQPSIPTGTSEPTRNGMPTTPVFSDSFKDPEGDGDFFTDLGDLSELASFCNDAFAKPKRQQSKTPGFSANFEDPFAKLKRQQSKTPGFSADF